MSITQIGRGTLSNYEPKSDADQMKDWMNMVHLCQVIRYWKAQRETTHNTEYIDATLKNAINKYQAIKDQYFKVVE